MTQVGYEKAAVAESAAAYHIRRVNSKLASGEYRTEFCRCFCGSDESVPVTEKDRYGFYYRAVLCKFCGLIYSNPRMTNETMRKFYANEYRPIYDDDSDSTEINFKNGIVRSKHLIDFLDFFDIKPGIVYDIGCNAGAWLKPFQDRGAIVHGVDFGPERIAYGKRIGLPIEVGGIDDLMATGQQADLIIMNHLLEHVSDLESELTKARTLLKDDGHLFIRVPGLMTWDINILFQNAHCWQFTAETLEYVMECCGFEEAYLDQHISSLWVKSDRYRKKSDRPVSAFKQNASYLFGGKQLLPLVRTYNKFPISQRRSHLTSALSSSLPDISELEGCEKGRPAIIIGGGPSVDSQLESIRSLKEQGGRIIAIERMAAWCRKHWIIPDYILAMDASDDVMESFNVISSDSTYLVAAQCPPEVIRSLKDAKTYLYQTPQRGVDLAWMWAAADRSRLTMVNGGGSVTICAMSMALLLGMREWHIFGFDCHVTNATYANGITGVGDQTHCYPVDIGDRTFTTTSPYLSFAQQFFLLRAQAVKEGRLDNVRVYGDSLVVAMSEEDIHGG